MIACASICAEPMRRISCQVLKKQQSKHYDHNSCVLGMKRFKHTKARRILTTTNQSFPFGNCIVLLRHLEDCNQLRQNNLICVKFVNLTNKNYVCELSMLHKMNFCDESKILKRYPQKIQHTVVHHVPCNFTSHGVKKISEL